jgi:hypothetical protein
VIVVLFGVRATYRVLQTRTFIQLLFCFFGWRILRDVGISPCLLNVSHFWAIKLISRVERGKICQNALQLVCIRFVDGFNVLLNGNFGLGELIDSDATEGGYLGAPS